MRTTRTIALFVALAAACSVRAADLTFEDRVRAEESIQRVYYAHQVGATQPFEAAVPTAVLEQRVRTYLDRWAAVEARLQAPVSPSMLSAEVERMERESRMPDRLRELEAALGNDPLLIEECLALPILVERLSRGSVEDGETVEAVAAAPAARNAPASIWTGSEMIVWGGYDDSGYQSTGGRYDPASDGWSATSTSGAPSPRGFLPMVWTGSKMIVWGGIDSIQRFQTGGMYDPATNSWTTMPTSGAPSARDNHTAVWTGTRMVVWGGETSTGGTNTGGVFDPVSNTWIAATSTTGAPAARTYHSAVWTGSRMIVFGGLVGRPAKTGGMYDPATNTWTLIKKMPSDGRMSHAAVWSGTEMIVWGGNASNNGGHPLYLNSGGRYNPATRRWTLTTLAGAPDPRYYASGVWTGSELVVWGGRNSVSLDTGGRYDPTTDTWTPTSTTGAPASRYVHRAEWTGSAMVVWGGGDFPHTTYFSSGGRYDPATDTWTPTAP